MPNIKLILEYDGGNYYGWQRQSSLPSIQGTIEKTIHRISGEKTTVIGAGRTDAGVHALGQTANFKTRSRLRAEEWKRALNSLLPDDITAQEVKIVPDKFHARFDAKGKVYRYRIFNSRVRSALGRQYQFTVYPPLKISRMKTASLLLRGKHDFSAFQSGSIKDHPRSAICTIKRLIITRKEDAVWLTIEADRFLHQMIRNMIGTLLEVGKGKRSPAEIKKILASKDRSRSGPTAPAKGLYLMTVKY